MRLAILNQHHTGRYSKIGAIFVIGPGLPATPATCPPPGPSRHREKGRMGGYRPRDGLGRAPVVFPGASRKTLELSYFHTKLLLVPAACCLLPSAFLLVGPPHISTVLFRCYPGYTLVWPRCGSRKSLRLQQFRMVFLRNRLELRHLSGPLLLANPP